MVAAGDLVVVLEAMKMEQPLTAHKAGTVTGLLGRGRRDRRQRRRALRDQGLTTCADGSARHWLVCSSCSPPAGRRAPAGHRRPGVGRRDIDAAAQPSRPSTSTTTPTPSGADRRRGRPAHRPGPAAGTPLWPRSADVDADVVRRPRRRARALRTAVGQGDVWRGDRADQFSRSRHGRRAPGRRQRRSTRTTTTALRRPLAVLHRCLAVGSTDGSGGGGPGGSSGSAARPARGPALCCPSSAAWRSAAAGIAARRRARERAAEAGCGEPCRGQAHLRGGRHRAGRGHRRPRPRHRRGHHDRRDAAALRAVAQRLRRREDRRSTGPPTRPTWTPSSASLEEGRFELACVRALQAGEPSPERRAPCFFNPQHGPSVQDVTWAPDGGAPREVPVCADCAARLSPAATTWTPARSGRRPEHAVLERRAAVRGLRGRLLQQLRQRAARAAARARCSAARWAAAGGTAAVAGAAAGAAPAAATCRAAVGVATGRAAAAISAVVAGTSAAAATSVVAATSGGGN